MFTEVPSDVGSRETPRTSRCTDRPPLRKNTRPSLIRTRHVRPLSAVDVFGPGLSKVGPRPETEAVEENSPLVKLFIPNTRRTDSHFDFSLGIRSVSPHVDVTQLMRVWFVYRRVEVWLSASRKRPYVNQGHVRIFYSVVEVFFLF